MPNLRHERQELRKLYWAYIEMAKRDDKDDLRGLTEDLVIKKTGVDRNRAPLLVEIILNGDGGSFINEVVQPIFHFLANEV